jgi:hypothetical protein
MSGTVYDGKTQQWKPANLPDALKYLNEVCSPLRWSAGQNRDHDEA